MNPPSSLIKLSWMNAPSSVIVNGKIFVIPHELSLLLKVSDDKYFIFNHRCHILSVVVPYTKGIDESTEIGTNMSRYLQFYPMKKIPFKYIRDHSNMPSDAYAMRQFSRNIMSDFNNSSSQTCQTHSAEINNSSYFGRWTSPRAG